MKAMKAGARAMTGGVLTKKIAESTQLKTKDVKGVLAALRTIACAEVKKTEKFVIPQLTTLKLKHKPARKAGKKMRWRRSSPRADGSNRYNRAPGARRQAHILNYITILLNSINCHYH